MRTLLAALCGGALLLAGCTTAPADRPDEIRVSGDRIFLPVEIEGQRVEALLDTGAEMTLVDTRLAEKAGVEKADAAEARGTGAAPVSVHFAEDVDMQAAGVALDDRTVVVLDLTDIAKRVVGEPLAMVMGRDLFDAGRFHLDIEAGRFHPLRESRTPEGVRVALSDANGIKQLPVMINGATVMADFDLGNGNEVHLSEAFARRAGLLTPERIVGTKSGGGLGGAVDQTLVRLDSLVIGGEEMGGLIATVSPAADGAEANLGVSVLRRFVMVVDFPENALWLTPRR